MTQQSVHQTQPTGAAHEAPGQALSVARSSDYPARLTRLDGWSADELLGEAVRRSADDVPALRTMQEHVLRAILLAIDRDAMGPASEAAGRRAP